MRLIEKFAHCDKSADGRDLVLTVDGEEHALTREQAARLRDDISDSLCTRQEYLRTAGEHREDGSYVVERRHTESSGHRKVFDQFDELERLYERLPDRFTVDEVGRTGLTGGRRHMLVHHLAEHSAFDCELVDRQPLTVAKLEDRPVDGEPSDPESEEAIAAD